MKKTLRMALCLMIVLVMALGLTACDKKAALIGEWEGEIGEEALATVLEQEIGDSLGEFGDYIDVSGLSLRFTIEFDEDGTGVAGITKEDAEAFGEELVEVIVEAGRAYLEATAEEAGYTFDELMSISGTTWEEMEEQLKAELDLDTLSEEIAIEEEFYYDLDGEDLLSGEEEDELSKDGTFDGEEIVLDMDEYGEITFKKID